MKIGIQLRSTISLQAISAIIPMVLWNYRNTNTSLTAVYIYIILPIGYYYIETTPTSRYLSNENYRLCVSLRKAILPPFLCSHCALLYNR